MTLEELRELLKKSWSRETSFDPKNWSPENPAWAQCAPTALLGQYFLGGQILKGLVRIQKPGYRYIIESTHLWNKLPDGRQIDLSAEQFRGTFTTRVGESKIVPRSDLMRIKHVRQRYSLLKSAVENLTQPKGRIMNVFSAGNSKMGQQVLLFNLPPLETCRPSEWCRKNCYALKGYHTFRSVKESQRKRLELSQRPDFVELAVAELKRSRYQYVRLHSAGDFYSEEYARKWIEIIKRCPEKLFRTTTKRVDLGWVLQELDSLPNMTVRESLDPTHPKPSGLLPTLTVIEGTPIDRELFFCRDDCVSCNYTCWKERISIKVKPL